MPLSKGTLSLCILAMPFRPISSECRYLSVLRTKQSQLCSNRSPILSSSTAQNNGGINFRLISYTSKAAKWARGRDAMGPELGASWARVSHLENPEFYTRDQPIKLNRPEDPSCTYRIAPNHTLRGEIPPADYIVSSLVGGMFFGLLFYNIYWHPDMLVGHFYEPYAGEEFTDEELGIPPDDAPDPEYWGHHGEPMGTY